MSYILKYILITAIILYILVSDAINNKIISNKSYLRNIMSNAENAGWFIVQNGFYRVIPQTLQEVNKVMKNLLH